MKVGVHMWQRPRSSILAFNEGQVMDVAAGRIKGSCWEGFDPRPGSGGVAGSGGQVRNAFCRVEHHGLAPWDTATEAICSFTFPKELTHLCCSLDPPPPTLNPQDERNGATQLMSGPLNPGTSSSPSSSESRICCTRNHYTTCLRNRLEGEAEGTDGVNTLKEQTHSTHPPP
ncbi:hypothetical protein I79_018513 [Cricetulus griseus]|uniref:Uncharacterized protein n=1 Tax=Cricetulus griseus TaxID=10029 RepID=G3I4X2_CRIGR|nr:hypothetical protein I79_018513 [Cricetulus griseus]